MSDRRRTRRGRPSARIVARFITGETWEGDLISFDPQTSRLKIRIGSEARELDGRYLKAIFFLRLPGEPPIPESRLKPAGMKVRVAFADGEEITGYSYGLRPLDPGFYLFPVNLKDRNERIYVFKNNAIGIRTEIK